MAYFKKHPMEQHMKMDRKMMETKEMGQLGGAIAKKFDENFIYNKKAEKTVEAQLNKIGATMNKLEKNVKLGGLPKGWTKNGPPMLVQQEQELMELAAYLENLWKTRNYLTIVSSIQ